MGIETLFTAKVVIFHSEVRRYRLGMEIRSSFSKKSGSDAQGKGGGEEGVPPNYVAVIKQRRRQRAPLHPAYWTLRSLLFLSPT